MLSSLLDLIFSSADLSPKEAVVGWLTHLRGSYPTFPFRVSSALLPPPEDDAKGKTKVSEKDGLGVEALVEYLSKTSPVSVAVIGMPNVSPLLELLLNEQPADPSHFVVGQISHHQHHMRLFSSGDV